MNLPDITPITRFLGRASLHISKHAPTILATTGVVGFVGTAILASKATLKLEDTITNHAEDLFELSQKEDANIKDRSVVYGSLALDVAKLYAPAIALGAFSAGCIFTGNGIMVRRVAGLTAAYAAVEEAFESYKVNVAEVLGEKGLTTLGQKAKKHFVEGEDTEEVKHSVDENWNFESYNSAYQFVFDETNPNWEVDSSYSETFLAVQQEWANNLLQARGHLFLNEVLDNLGIDRTPAGAVVGWTLDGDGDGRVDFGICKHSEKYLDGNDGWHITDTFALDFNVDGVIYDKI